MFSKTTKTFVITSTLICSSLTSPATLADEQSAIQSVDDIRDPFYIGLGLGISFLKPETNSVALTLSQDSDFAYKVFGGYQFTDNWAAEFFWADMGQAEVSSGSTIAGIVEYQSFGVGGLYQYPLSDNWDVFATAGLGRLRNSFQIINAERVEDSFTYVGAGVMWNMAKTWDLRAEYDYYDKDAQMLSFNIVKRFGSATPKRIARLESKVQQQETALANVLAKPVAVKKNKTCDDYSIELKGVVFAKRSVELTDNSKQILDGVAEKLLKLPEDISFEIRAHTDTEGTELYNYTLSLARARNVRDYFSSQGIALSRIEAQGYGEWRPLQSNQTEAGRDANRRAELVLIGVERHVEDTGSCPVLAAP
ncbi:MAG: OmpA family protein [Proteobacteria bacterium]|nr:OmpA family protein [Pseudomonadota bacterium]